MNLSDLANGPMLTEAQRKLLARGRKKPGLYAAQPGTGPQSETCGTCSHLYRKRMAKTYLKCGLVASEWTGGGGTDIKAKSPACSKWKYSEIAR